MLSDLKGRTGHDALMVLDCLVALLADPKAFRVGMEEAAKLADRNEEVLTETRQKLEATQKLAEKLEKGEAALAKAQAEFEKQRKQEVDRLRGEAEQIAQRRLTLEQAEKDLAKRTQQEREELTLLANGVQAEKAAAANALQAAFAVKAECKDLSPWIDKAKQLKEFATNG